MRCDPANLIVSMRKLLARLSDNMNHKIREKGKISN